MWGQYNYTALSLCERSIADALADGCAWSPDYFREWIRRSAPGAKLNSDDIAHPSAEADVVRAAILGHIVTEEGRIRGAGMRGAQIHALRVKGDFDLFAVKFDAPLLFEDCCFEGFVSIEDAHLGRVSLNGSSLAGFNADRVLLEGELSLERLKCSQTVNLRRAQIARSLRLGGAQLSGGGRNRALDGSDVCIGGSVDVREGFRSLGEVRLVGAKIGGNLFCNGAILDAGVHKVALYCNNASIAGSVFLRDGFSATGEVNFVFANIGGRLSCGGGRFENRRGYALNCDTLVVKGGVFLDTRLGKCFSSFGSIYLRRAVVNGELVCSGGQFDRGQSDLAIDANQIEVGADLRLDKGFSAKGPVDFGGSKIRGRMISNDCTMDCDNVRNKEMARTWPALNFGASTFDASVILGEKFSAFGRVNFARARIEGNLGAHGARYDSGDDHYALDFHSARIGAVLYFTMIGEIHGGVDLQDVHCAGFADDGSYWKKTRSRKLSFSRLWHGGTKEKEKFHQNLDGFCYQSFAHDYYSGFTDTTAKTRLAWLKIPSLKGKEKKRAFLPQPYTHCALILRNMGLRRAADEILSHRERLGRKHEKQALLIWLLNVVVDVFSANGQRPHRMLNTMAMLWLVGTLVFSASFYAGHMTVTSDHVVVSSEYRVAMAKKEYPVPVHYEPFAPLVYSLDVLLPVINLSQQELWRPMDMAEAPIAPSGECYTLPVECSLGRALGRLAVIAPKWIWYIPKAYYWIEEVAGWLFSTILAASFAGLIGKQEE